MRFQRIAGVCSMVIAFLSVFLIVALVLLFPRLGLTPTDWNDPVKGIAAWTASPTTFILWDIDFLLWAMAFVPLALALRYRLEAAAPSLAQIVLIGLSVASALWLAAGTVNIMGKPPIVVANDVSAFRSLSTISLGLGCGADFAFGWALLLVGWAGLKTAKLPKALDWLLLVEGACFILELATMVLSLVGLILAVITSIWIGTILLREPVTKEIPSA
jgi:hypothetical protein